MTIKQRRIPFLLATAIAVCVPAVTTSANASPATTVGEGGRLVFSRVGGGYGEATLFVADLATGAERLLLEYGDVECCPWASRDGSRVVFAYLTGDEQVYPGTIDVDGSNYRVFDPPANGLNLGAGPFAPDGRQIAFEGFHPTDDSAAGIYLGSSVDGSEPIRLTDKPDIPGDFSPDGSQLVFHRMDPADPVPLHGSLMVLDVEGSEVRELAPAGTVVRCCPRWSPDGSRIVFADPDGSLWLIDPDGSNVTEIFHGSADNGYALSAAWSPSGQHLAYAVNSGPNPWAHPTNQIVIVDADGSNPVVVIDSNDHKRDLSWVPAGNAPGEDELLPEGSLANPASATDGCGIAPAEPPGETSSRTITVDDEERTFLLFVPSGYDLSEPTALVLNLHGAGQRAADHAETSELTDTAESAGFIVVHPEASPSTDFNWQFEARAEAELFDELLDALGTELCLDRNRVFAVGASQGGDLATLLACQLGERIAAVASVTVLNHHDSCPTPTPTPVLAFVGTADPIYDIDEGLQLPPGVGGVAPAELLPGPLADEAAAWAATNGCDPQSTVDDFADGIARHEFDCPDGNDLVYYIHPGGHVWPGTDPPAEFVAELGPAVPSLDANQLIWEFFDGHPADGRASSDDELLPEGVYRTPEVTRDELIATGVAAGFDADEVEAFLDADGIEESARFGLRLASGGWTQLFSYDGGPEGVGWRGTYEVVDEDTVIATDPCGPITYTYMLDGDELTLDMIDNQCGAEDVLPQTIIFETAPFVRVQEETPDAAVTTAVEPATHTSTDFVVPFEVALPEWVDAEPAVEEPNFVTWEATAADRGIRFLAPVNVYPPGSATTEPLPDDYVGYLFSQVDHGAIFEDVVETTVDGHPATVVTATVADSLDGGLGCQAEGLAAEDCFGLQPDLSLRLAVIEVGDQPLLIWVRDIRGVDVEYDTFDAMLASLRFLEPADAGAPSGDAVVGLTARYAGETDAPLGYYEYVPPGYAEGDPRPLLVFLEGVDEHGDGSEGELERLLATGIPELLSSGEWPAERPFVVLAPQHAPPADLAPYDGCFDTPQLATGCFRVQTEAGHPEGGSLCHTPTEVHDFIAYALDAYDVDPDRVYLTGLSCGAYATWEYVAEHGASQIAAMVPIAGEGRFAWERAGCALGEVAIWAFHGDADDAVLPAGSIELLTNLADCPDATDHMLTIYPGVDHDSWTRTYDLSGGHDIYEWLLQHQRGSAEAS